MCPPARRLNKCRPAPERPADQRGGRAPGRQEPLRNQLSAPSRRNPVPDGVHSALLGRDQDRSQTALSRRASRRRSSQDDAVHGRESAQLSVHAGSQPGRQPGRSRTTDQARPGARRSRCAAMESSPSRPERPPRAQPNSRIRDKISSNLNLKDATIVRTTIGPAADSASPSMRPMLCSNIAGLSSAHSPCSSPSADGWSRNGNPYPQQAQHRHRKTSGAPGDPSAAPRSSRARDHGQHSDAAKSSMLLEALKEELFQLEVEKKQGKITPADYEKARAALDQTLERALKRQG